MTLVLHIQCEYIFDAIDAYDAHSSLLGISLKVELEHVILYYRAIDSMSKFLTESFVEDDIHEWSMTL